MPEREIVVYMFAVGGGAFDAPSDDLIYDHEIHSIEV
jgi:hypothetical protein